MTVNFYEGKDNKPHRLFVQPDRVTMHDRIVFTEAYYSVDNNCVQLYGVLSFQCVGIENSKEKTWKADNQKVLLAFYKDKKPTWNNETKKFEDKEVDPSENYLYEFAKNVLEKFNGECVSVIIAPYVAPQFLEDMQVPQEEAVIAYWEAKVKNTVIAVQVDSKLLTNADKELLKSNSSHSGGGKTYQKSETESEKLEARWEFVKQHLGKDFPINSLYELGTLLAIQHVEEDALENQKILAKAFELITGMWK